MSTPEITFADEKSVGWLVWEKKVVAAVARTYQCNQIEKVVLLSCNVRGIHNGFFIWIDSSMVIIVACSCCPRYQRPCYGRFRRRFVVIRVNFFERGLRRKSLPRCHGLQYRVYVSMNATRRSEDPRLALVLLLSFCWVPGNALVVSAANPRF